MDGFSTRKTMRGTGAAAAMAIAVLIVGAFPADAFAGKRAARHDATVATEWFDLLYDAVLTEKLPPMVAARIYGYAGVALYESVVPGMPGYQSLAGQVNELPAMPPVLERRLYHWPTVANSAMAELSRGLFGTATAPTQQAITDLEGAMNGAHRTLPKKIRARSVDQGRAVAQAILAWAAQDDYASLNNCSYTPPTGPGMWVPTPPAFRAALQPCWGQLRTFALTSGGECMPPPPPAFSTSPTSAFYGEANEVYLTGNAGSALTAEQREIALFWSDDPGTTGTPAGHWVSIVGQVARDRGLNLEQASVAYAGVGIAVADSFIGCWAAKFEYNLLRPVTYIQSNIDATWTPLLATPPFPEYTSGHSTQSAAAAALMSDLLGDAPFTDRTHEFRGVPGRSFDTFEEAAAEAAISRLYGGIHYRAAIEIGLEQGACIGAAILDRVEFRRR